MADKQIFTQVMGGKYRGKKLKLPSLETTRSTKSIIKESLFNTLQFDICDANFVEVFGGSGSMGIEALSRGAKRAYFIEKDKSAYKILVENCNSIEQNSCTCRAGDAFLELPKIVKECEGRTYLYFDPPFDFRDGMSGIYEKCFEVLKSIDATQIQLVIFEHESRVKLPESIGKYALKKQKKFGKSTLSYYD